MKTHSLRDAVMDGTLPESSILCGLSEENIHHLSAHHAEALLAIRLRNSSADGRTILSVADLARWMRERDFLIADGRRWQYADILDVFPIGS